MTVAIERPHTSDIGRRAYILYDRLREKVEIEENIGKLIVFDVESGDYEIDELGIETSLRLKAKHTNAELYAIRIGYKTTEVLGGILERTES